jgi:hypothetical protein
MDYGRIKLLLLLPLRITRRETLRALFEELKSALGFAK